MSDFTFKASTQSAMDMEPRLLLAQYGGGYEQAAADGPNSMLRKWSLVFNNRSWDDLTTIDTFLKGKGGFQTFTWTPIEPLNAAEVKVRCKKWRASWDTGGQIVAIAAEFQEVAA